MITLLTGENSFELERTLQKIADDFEGVAEKIDGSILELKQLPDLLMGGTLFAERRLIVIKQLSENKTLWTNLTDWLPRVSADVHLVLVEPKPDKRTRTFKDLQKAARVEEFKLWSERDTSMAEKWLITEAQTQGFVLDAVSARALVRRVGVDQWALYRALEKLAVLDEVTPAVIADIIELSPAENVFNLFETALRGNTPAVSQMIRTFELTEDPYRLFGLLSGQVFQLAALAVSDRPSEEVAKALGAHPYAVSKMTAHANTLGKSGAKKVLAAFVEADDGMKTSVVEPWLLIERALVKISSI